ncbi:MAG: preprotein translocase subunit SecE [Candidatus Parcubacteria bacterium]|nr:preprotein translocase subunit SecE [Candidatus Parcubacteria bacterium]
MKITTLPHKLILYFKQVKTEVKKINWPTRQETVRYALTVIVISSVVAVFLGGLDLAFGSLLRKVITLF